MTCVESLPIVSTMADRPCFVTDRKVCDAAAALMASTAMSIEPSCRQRWRIISSKSEACGVLKSCVLGRMQATLTVPFLNPTDIDSAEVSSL